MVTNDKKTTRKPLVGKKFTSEYQPENNGRPKGSISIETRIRRILETDAELPKSIKEAIKAQCGGDKKAIDAMILVGMLQALQGDSGWFKAVMEHGYGKPTTKIAGVGDDGEQKPLEIKVTYGK